MDVHISFTKPLCLAPHLTGRELLRQLGLSQDDELVLHRHGHERPIQDDESCELAQGDHLTCRPRHHSVTVHLNHRPVTFDIPRQTGLSIKEKAGISPSDALFLDVACGPDVVIPNDTEICLQDGSCLFTQPGADYGSPAQATLAKEVFPTGAILLPQPEGWTFVILKDQQLPEVFSPERTDILVKLPPGFPDAAPDMFWCLPHVTLRNGAPPQATSHEPINGVLWQRFSWHLRQGVWQPGVSTFADFLRCIRGRFATGL